MAHAVSLSTLRFEHMSPTAAGMAATLHVLAAVFLLWGTPFKNFEVPERAIEVTMEEPPQTKTQPPTPPQPPPAVQQPPAAQKPPATQPAPPPTGLPPTEEKPTVTDKTTTVPLGLPPPSQRTTEPPQQAAAPPPPKPAPVPEPAPQAEAKLPAVDVPNAPLNMQDFVRAAPPPPPQEIVRPQPRVQPAPPPSTPTVPQQHPPTVQQPHPSQLQPSPLQTNQHAPSEAHASATLVNPADAAARSRIVDDYLWQVGRKISEHRTFSASGNEHGTVIMRLTIARDGRLMEAGVARSSGSNNLDAASLALARAASPYPPLPAELTGNQVTFVLPLSYRKYD